MRVITAHIVGVKGLLNRHHLSFAENALASTFPDQNHFTSFFLNLTGTLPGMRRWFRTAA